MKPPHRRCVWNEYFQDMGANYSDSMVFKRGGKGVRVCLNMNCLLSSEIRNENIKMTGETPEVRSDK